VTERTPTSPEAGSTDEPWSDHLEPARVLGRAAFGGAVRALLGAVVFGAICCATAEVLYQKNVLPWWTGPSAARHLNPAYGDEVALAAILAIASGILRPIELLARFLKPEASYPRKLAMGLVVAVASTIAAAALLYQLQYARGILTGGTVEAGLHGIASANGLLGHRDPKELLGIALAFGIAGFGRARGLPLWEQVALLAPFALLYLAPTLVYEGIVVSGGSGWGHDEELALWVTAWLSAVLLPGVAALGDRLERRFLPRFLASKEGNPMLRTTLVLALALGLAGCASKPPSEKPPTVKPKLELRLTCEIDKPDALKLGAPVPVRVTVANVGEVSAEYVEDGGDRERRALHVIAPDGKELNWKGAGITKTVLSGQRLAPGETRTVLSGYDLATQYDLSQPGTYTVSLTRVTLSKDLDPVDSNRIEIPLK
jgi:hypothetical protein